MTASVQAIKVQNDHWASRLKALIVLTIVWDFTIVVFGMLFAPPFQGANFSFGLSDTLLRFFYPYESMFFHSLAIPFVALTYDALVIFGVEGRRARSL